MDDGQQSVVPIRGPSPKFRDQRMASLTNQLFRLTIQAMKVRHTKTR